MGIQEVNNQLRRQEGLPPSGGGARDERVASALGERRRGALRSDPPVQRIDVQTKLLWMSYLATGLLVLNAGLLILVLNTL